MNFQVPASWVSGWQNNTECSTTENIRERLSHHFTLTLNAALQRTSEKGYHTTLHWHWMQRCREHLRKAITPLYTDTECSAAEHLWVKAYTLRRRNRTAPKLRSLGVMKPLTGSDDDGAVPRREKRDTHREMMCVRDREGERERETPHETNDHKFRKLDELFSDNRT